MGEVVDLATKAVAVSDDAAARASFLDEGEIDEFILSVVPTLIGEGIPLIAPRHRTVPLKLISCTKFTDGLVKLHYSVGKQPAPAKVTSAGERARRS